jgi:UDP-N-acetylglucosamine transferase subunit ALG13
VSGLVVALAGTDHHPFDRMVQWVDAAAERRRDVRFVIQHGATRPPLVAEGHGFLSHARLVDVLSEASVVVCHGGPGLITEALEAGHVPLCMPRDPSLGEHVDGHQQRFARLVGQAGIVRLVPSLDAFHRALDKALAETPGSRAAHAATAARDTARARIAAELDDLICRRPGRLGRRRRVAAP